MTDVRRRQPAEGFSPGEYLKDFLSSKGWSQTDLADILGRPPRVINEIIAGKRAITPDTALRLARYLGTTSAYWINLQAHYDLETARRRSERRILADVTPLAA